MMKRETDKFGDVAESMLERAMTEMIDDDVLTASVKFDGKDGRPMLKDASRHKRSGLWFGPKAVEFKESHTKLPDW